MRRQREAGLLVAPAAAVLLVLFVGSQLLMFEASLGRRSPYGGIVHEWTGANYVRVFEPLYLLVFARSVGLAVATTLACLALGYPVAYWLARRASGPARRALVVLVILPFWTSLLVRMYAWVFLLRTEGVLNLALASVGLPAANLLYTPWAVLLGQVYGELPFMILPLFTSLEKLDPSLLDAAADLGASPGAVFRRVVLPLTRPGAAAGAVLVFVPTLGAFLAPDLLGGARTAYLGNLIQAQFAAARDAPFGSALSFALSLVVLSLGLACRRPLEEAQPGGAR
jgi:spermidine/putrescine transport system permease protein